MWTDLQNFISAVGFPIAVTVFLLYRIVPKIDEMLLILCSLYAHMTGRDWRTTKKKKGED